MRAATLVLLFAVIGVACVQDAEAQFGGGFPGGSGRGSRGARGDSARDSPSQQRPMRESGADAVYVLTEELRADLKLTPEQEPAWESFLHKLDAMRNDMTRERVRAQRQTEATAPQQIDQSVDSARNRLTAMEEVAIEAKALYAKLGDGQKKVADTRLARLLQRP